MITCRRPGVAPPPSRPSRSRHAVISPAEAIVELERRAMLADLATFCRGAWTVLKPTEEYSHNWHIEVVCYHLMGLFWGWPMTSGPGAGQPLRDLVINIPPRHMKSLVCSVMFPAWAWAHDPGRQFFYASYAQHLSDEHAMLMLQLVQSQWYQTRFGRTGNPYFDSADHPLVLGGRRQVRHFTTDAGGARQSSSVMGKATGTGGDVIATDDAHNVMQRESPKAIARVITWWAKAMSSRGNNPRKFCRLVVGQRVLQGDLPGWCLEQGYAGLVLAARFEGQEEVGVFGHRDPRTAEGEPLWSDRFGEAELSKLERDLQDDADGQLQQRPTKRGGRTFRIDSLRRFGQRVYDALLVPGGLDEIVVVFDLGLKGRMERQGRSTQAGKRSYSVGAVWGRRAGDVFLLDVWREQVGPVEIVARARALCKRWERAALKLFEEGGAGYTTAVALEGEIAGVMTVRPKMDKDIRAYGIAPFWASGNVWVPQDGMFPWIAPWMLEHELFPNANNDDQVDTTSMALDYLLTKRWVEPMLPEGGTLRDEGPPEVVDAREAARSRLRNSWEDEHPEGMGAVVYTGRRYNPPHMG